MLEAPESYAIGITSSQGTQGQTPPIAQSRIYGYFVNLGAADGIWSDPLFSFTRNGARGWTRAPLERHGHNFRMLDGSMATHPIS